MNGDGSPDLLIFEQDQSAQQRLMIVYNEGGTGQNFLEQTLATTGGHNEWVGDVNGDGSLDIVNSRHGFYSQINPIDIWMNGLTSSGAVKATITSSPQSQSVADRQQRHLPGDGDLGQYARLPVAAGWRRYSGGDRAARIPLPSPRSPTTA